MNEENKIVKFIFENHNRLSCIIRYNNTPKLSPESVAEHSYYVAFLVMLIGDYLVDKGVRLNKERLMKAAMLHDIEEIISGDVIKILKVGDFKIALDKLNRRSMQHLCEVLGGRRADDYLQIWEETKAKESIEAKIVDMADMMSVLIYCVKEVHCGNRYFKEILIFASATIDTFRDTVPKADKIIKAFIDYVRKYLADDREITDGIDKAVRIDQE